MWEHCGVVRAADELARGLDRLAQIRDNLDRIDVRPSDEGWADLVLALDVRAMLDTAEATIRCAVERRETRGAHNRSDFPELDPALTRNLYVRRDPASGALDVGSEPVPAVPEALKSWAYQEGGDPGAEKLLE
jgi:succinate dehydrogenase / fumarate reductase flavoprotein subunit